MHLLAVGVLGKVSWFQKGDPRKRQVDVTPRTWEATLPGHWRASGDSMDKAGVVL